MYRCLSLASLALGDTHPNPMVGCVIVYNHKIIAEGYHKKAGDKHAEIVALEKVKDYHILPESTMYINMEPCTHYGKTPPCAPALIQSNIGTFVIAHADPNPLVHGKGIAALKMQQRNVIENVLTKESLWLNRRFITYHQQKRPYVILKWAESANGYTDIDRNSIETKGSYPISGKYSAYLTHQWRKEEHAIYIGYRTAIHDNPQLNVRKAYGNNPIIVVEDKDLSLPRSLNIFRQGRKVIVLNTIKDAEEENISYVKIKDLTDIPHILSILYKMNIVSVLVEGGLHTHLKFIASRQYDEIRRIRNQRSLLHGNLPAPVIREIPQHEFTFFEDRFSIYYHSLHLIHP